MAVVLEPKSSTIDIDGNGHYRPLDSQIHLELSSNSVRLLPRQSATIFYKVTSPDTPAWLCIYAQFMPLHPGPGLNVQVLLPHTIYLYGRRPLTREDIQVTRAAFEIDTHRLEVEITNKGSAAGRVEQVHMSRGHTSTDNPDFPLLPGQTCRLTLEWLEAKPPQQLALDFANFTLKIPIDSLSKKANSELSSLGAAQIFISS